jgi:DMSO/TMAO reductase YedYZ heme-binding membrane subunit
MRISKLLDNSRFYILAISLLVSLAVIGLMRLQIPSDQLFYIRTQQLFGLLGVLFWYFALMISPLGYVIGKQRIKKLEFARRAIGVSAFYFVLLHGAIALWGQLGGISEIQYLPELFKWSLLGGAIAFAVLLLMALTSFDKVVRFMTFPRWKLLHRLVYSGGVLAILHIWTVGTHLAYDVVQLTAFVLLVILFGLELYRITKKLNEKYLHLEKTESITLFIASWAIAATLVLLIPSVVQNYHSRHTDHTANNERSV